MKSDWSRREFLAASVPASAFLSGCMSSPPPPNEIQMNVSGLDPSDGSIYDVEVLDTSASGFDRVSVQLQVWLEPSTSPRTVRRFIPASGGETGLTMVSERPSVGVFRFWTYTDVSFNRIVVLNRDGDTLDEVTIRLNAPGEPDYRESPNDESGAEAD